MQRIFVSPPYKTIKDLKNCFSLFKNNAQGCHFDLMDGKFVQTKQMHVDVINEARLLTHVPFWIHLMTENPHKIIEYLYLYPGDTVSFHYEAFQKKGSLEALAEQLEHKNLRPSLAINPCTSIEKISHLLHAIDHLLIMSVEPGASGQPFIPHTFQKLEMLEMYCLSQEFDLIIAMDGGINRSNIAQLAQAGVQEVAITSALFNAQNPVAALKELSALFL